jgi:hypothetical protein
MTSRSSTRFLWKTMVSPQTTYKDFINPPGDLRSRFTRASLKMQLCLGNYGGSAFRGFRDLDQYLDPREF